MRCLFLLLLVFATGAVAEPIPEMRRLSTPAPSHVLFIGNSYLYYGDSIHYHVEMMAKHANPEAEIAPDYGSITISGGRLEDHDLPRYLERAARTLGHPFDAVILQGHSTATFKEHREHFAKVVTEMVDTVRRSGAQPVLYMTPAYSETSDAYRGTMLNDLDKIYTELANRVDAIVVPVALAYALAEERRPDIVLRKPWDGSHPSRFGTYLAAATVYATLFSDPVTEVKYTYFGSIPEDEAVFLREAAQDAVNAYHDRMGR